MVLMEQDSSHLATIAHKVTTSSAMTPALLLCLIVCPVALLGTISLFYWEVWPAAILILLVGCVPLVMACWQIVHFTRTDPNRLQGEEHLERMLQIKQTIGIKDGDTLKMINVSGELGRNPALEGGQVE